jgi:hypothetical protein
MTQIECALDKGYKLVCVSAIPNLLDSEAIEYASGTESILGN